MVILKLPKADLSIKSKENKQFIFDIIRKKYMVLTPEEWVRQHVVHYLVNQLKYPKSIIAIEKQLTINALKKRFDILVFNSKGIADIIVECKAPNVKITQKTFDQIARYNLKLNAQFLMVTNGLDHYFCKMDNKNEKYVFLEELPEFKR